MFLLCFLGALGNVGGFVFLKLFFQETNFYTILELDMLVCICMFLMSFYHLVKFRNSEDKELINRPELVVVLCIGAIIGSIIGTLVYFYVYNTYGEESLKTLQTLIIFTLALNSLLYNLFSSYVQTFDIRTYLPCTVVGIILGFFCSVSNIGLLFLLVLVPLIMFNTTYNGSSNIATFVLFFAVTAKIIVTYLISPVQLYALPYLLPLIFLSFIANYLGTYFRQKLTNRTKFFLYNISLVFIITLSIFNLH